MTAGELLVLDDHLDLVRRRWAPRLALDADDEAQALGDSLPMGLRVHSGATPDPSTAVKGA